jgi:hypothetical protein
MLPQYRGNEMGMFRLSGGTLAQPTKCEDEENMSHLKLTLAHNQSINQSINQSSLIALFGSYAILHYTGCLKAHVTNFSWVFPTPT